MRQVVLVFGAAGHVGMAVSCHLVTESSWDVRRLTHHDIDVAKLRISWLEPATIDAVVYCVGHCPPGGFLKAGMSPLSVLGPGELEREIDAYMRGPFNVFQMTLSAMRERGHYVFLSSAALKWGVPLGEQPQYHMSHHRAAIEGQKALIEGMHTDPMVIRKGIFIHRVAPTAISDSPFHSKSGDTVFSTTTERVVKAVVNCLASSKSCDIEW